MWRIFDKIYDIQTELDKFDEKLNNLFELQQNNSKLNNGRIDKLNGIIENQNQIYNERFKSLFELNQNNSKLKNERIDKLFKIIENLSQNQVNISKSILKLENKFSAIPMKLPLCKDI